MVLFAQRLQPVGARLFEFLQLHALRELVDGFLELSIRDDGKGMSRDPGDNGMGLMTMRRRAEMIDGEFSIQASPGGGTHIRCRVPFES